MEILQEVKEKALKLSVPIMQENAIKKLQEILFKTVLDKKFDIIEKENTFNILEIGTGVGYSTLKMLVSISELVDIENICINLITLEKNSELCCIANSYFKNTKFSKSIRLIEGDAINFIVKTDIKFDFILLDGPKGQYENYRPYLKNLINKNGIIFADNILFKGYIEGGYNDHKHKTIVSSIKLYLKNMQDDLEFLTEIEKIGDGILVSKKI